MKPLNDLQRSQCRCWKAGCFVPDPMLKDDFRQLLPAELISVSNKWNFKRYLMLHGKQSNQHWDAITRFTNSPPRLIHLWAEDFSGRNYLKPIKNCTNSHCIFLKIWPFKLLSVKNSLKENLKF